MRFQSHLVSLDINIKEVFLKAKPYCSLSFQISADDKTVSLEKHSYPLENDHSLIYEHCQLQLQAQFDTTSQAYTPKQVFLQIFLGQDSGSSVVGNITFNPFEARFQEKDWEFNLQNFSPDSKILFSSKLLLISKKERLPKYTQAYKEDPYKLQKQKNEVKESKKFSKKSSSNDLILPESKIKLKQSYHSQKLQQANRQHNKTKKLQSPKSIELSKNVAVAKGLNPKFTQQATQREKIYDEVEKLKKRIQEERAQKVRSISKLKIEANPKLLGGQIVQGNNEVNRLKEKIRSFQKKEKNLQINIQDLLKQLDRGKEKQVHLEKRKQELERTIGEKDIKLRAANQTIRALNQQIDCLNSRERIVSKKGEVKENIFKDQTKRLQQRLRQAELQINNAIAEKNETIQKVADLEKRHQALLREKDLKLNQEKNKNLKLRQQLIAHQKQLEVVVQDLNLQNEEITKMNIANQQKMHELQIRAQKHQKEAVELRQKLKMQKEKCNLLQQEHQKNQGQEVFNHKKKYNQLNSQHLAAQERIKRCQTQIRQYQNKVKVLQQNLKTKATDNQKHLSRIQGLQKELNSTKEEKNRKIVEIQHLKTTLATLNDKIAEMRQKLQSQKSRRQDTNYDLQKNAVLFKQQKDSLQAEINQYKWSLVKNNDIINEFEIKIKALNEDIMKYNQQIMLKTQRIVTLEENNKLLQIQSQHLQKEKQGLILKNRESADVIKLKQSQLEEQIKKKTRLQQKYQEEKQRANQLQLSLKNRENIEQKKQRDKQEMVKCKSEEYQKMEAELFKKIQQGVALKSSLDIALRQIQLVKNDYESSKNELNILRAQNSCVKDQLQEQIAKYQSIKLQLQLANEKLKVQVKKNQSIKSQHEDYRRGIKASFENLVGQFFKEQTSNIVATTLIPFADQALSSLQIQLIQKRNNSIIKQRQTDATYQHQITTLQNQLKELKELFEKKQNDLKNNEFQERQKLKGLLYEGMIEKNNLTEQINRITQQRQQLHRDMQRLRRQIITKDQHQQQLNGQLQIFLLQHDSLKAQNNELNDLLFKNREQEIKNRAEYQQKQMEQQQEYSRDIERAKLQLIEKDRKIIGLERQLIELGEKRKAGEVQAAQLKVQAESSGDRLKEMELKLVFAQTQITKLNNSMRSYQKSQLQAKQIIEKQQNQIKKQQFKEQTLGGTISSLQAELMQSNIERQRLTCQISNLKERLQETQRVLNEKGEASKQKISKKMEENGQLKSKLIEKQSELSMRQFYLKQKEQLISSLTLDKQQQKNTIVALKSKIKELIQIRQSNQSRLREYSRQIQRLDAEIKKTQQIINKTNYTLIAMQNQLQLKDALQEQLKAKENQCLQLRQEKAQSSQSYLQTVKNYQQKIAAFKKQLQGQRNQSKSMKDEHRVIISRAESSNAEKYNTLLLQLQQERDEFEKRVGEIQSHNKSVIAQLQAKIEQLTQQVEQYKTNQKSLQEEVAKRDAQYTSIKKKLRDTQQAFQEIKQKYNRYYLLYEQSKHQIEQLIRSQDQRAMKIMTSARLSMIRSLNQKLSELSRKIERFKYSVETSVKKGTFTRKQFLAEFNHIFSKLREYLLESEEKESDSMEVKRQKEKHNY